MLRQKLNAQSNDIKLIESNQNHQIKQIREEMQALVEDNQRLQNQLSKVKILVIQLDKIVTSALLGRDAPTKLSSFEESASDLPDDQTFQASLDQLCHNITEFIGHHKRIRDNFGVFNGSSAQKSQFNKIRSLSTNQSTFTNNILRNDDDT